MFHNKIKKEPNNQKPLQHVATNTNQSNKPKNSGNYYTNKHNEEIKQITEIANFISKILNSIHTCLSQTPNKEQSRNQTNIYNSLTLDNANKYSYPNTPNNSNSHFQSNCYQTNNSTKRNSFQKKNHMEL